MRSMQWQLGILGTISAFAFRNRETTKKKPVSRWPVAGPYEYRLLASSPATKEKTKNKSNAYIVQQIHKRKTSHTRQLQQYIRSTNNNYTQDNLKLATEHVRQIRIQRVQKVKHPNKRVLCTVSCNFFFQSLIHSHFHPSPSLLITYYSYKPFP